MVVPKMEDAQIAVLKESAKDLHDKGAVITSSMYDYFFHEHPSMKPYFSEVFLGKMATDDNKGHTSAMSKAMAHIFFNFALHVHDIDKFADDLERISYKHVSRGIKAEFYPFLGDALIKAIKDVVGDKPEVLKAWRHAYDQVTDIFIENEKRIAKELQDTPHAWEGFRKFKVVKVQEEDLDDLSEEEEDMNEQEKKELEGEVEPGGYHKKYYYYLEAVDGDKAMPPFTTGRYICVKFNIDGVVSHRNYTLDTISENRLVISVKCKHIDPVHTSEFMRSTWKEGLEVESSSPMGFFLLLESISLKQD